MKAFIITAVLGVAMASYECLSCKFKDENSGFLYSYSYCNDEGFEICAGDSWNLINQKANCLGKFQAGYTLDIQEDCNADEIPGKCPEFVADESNVGVYMNYTKVLDANEKCTFFVDATASVARVIFDDANVLGVLYPGYVMGEPITVEQGLKKYITIYNGGNLKAISFKVSFSGASGLVSGMAAALVALMLY